MNPPVAPEDTTEQRSLAESVVGGSMTVLGGQIAIKIAAIAFNIVVIRYLGSEQYGKFAICVAFGGLFAVLSDLGLAPLAVKRVARDQSTIADMFSNFVVLRILLAIAVVCLTAFLAWLFGYPGDIRLGIFIAAMGLISYAFFGLADSVAIGLERFRVSATMNVVNQLVVMMLAGILVLSGKGFLGLLVASTLGPLFVSMVAIRYLNRQAPLRSRVQPTQWPSMLRSALPFAAISLALAISYKADMVILSAFTTVSAIGLYAVAYNLVFTVVSVSHSINLALYPVMTRQHAISPERSQVVFQQGVKYLLFFSLPFAVFMSINAPSIVTFLYGQEFAGAATALAIICWVIPLMFLGEYLGYVAIVLDRESMAARANWISSSANVTGNLMFVPFFGVVAAAAITVITEMLLVGQYFHSLRSRGVYSNTIGPVSRVVAAALLLGIASMTMRQFDLNLLVVGSVSVAFYFGVSTTIGAIGRSEYVIVKNLIAQKFGPRDPFKSDRNTLPLNR